MGHVKGYSALLGTRGCSIVLTQCIGQARLVHAVGPWAHEAICGSALLHHGATYTRVLTGYSQVLMGGYQQGFRMARTLRLRVLRVRSADTRSDEHARADQRRRHQPAHARADRIADLGDLRADHIADVSGRCAPRAFDAAHVPALCRGTDGTVLVVLGRHRAIVPHLTRTTRCCIHTYMRVCVSSQEHRTLSASAALMALMRHPLWSVRRTQADRRTGLGFRGATARAVP
jgi:hypothetical protein